MSKMNDLSGKHVAILVDNYFEQAEFEEPFRALKDAGAEVTIISTKEMHLQGLNHIDKADKFEADLTLDQADWIDYDALVLPGGAINADSLRVNEDAKQFATEFLDSGKPIAVICHAPWLLVSADLVGDRKLTSYHTIRDDIVNAGGEWLDIPVVIDDNLITSRQPDDLPQFNEALITMLKKQPSMAVEESSDNIVGKSETDNEIRTRARSMGYDETRDEIDSKDEEDLVNDQDIDDEEILQPSTLGPKEERTDTY